MSGIEFVLHDPVSPERVDDVKRAAETLHRVMMAEAAALCHAAERAGGTISATPTPPGENP